MRPAFARNQDRKLEFLPDLLKLSHFSILALAIPGSSSSWQLCGLRSVQAQGRMSDVESMLRDFPDIAQLLQFHGVLGSESKPLLEMVIKKGQNNP